MENQRFNINLNNLNFSLNQIKYFVTVAETLNFTKAADILYVPQSSVSQQISQFEEKIGVKLFDRDTRSVKLTSAGTLFYQETQKILSQTEKAILNAKRAQEGFLGTITIGFLAGPVMNLLPSLIHNLAVKYPDIEIILKHLTTEQINERLLNNDIDVAFTIQLGTKSSDKLVKTYLTSSPLCVYLAKNHRLADRTLISLDELANEPFILRDRKVVSLWYDYVKNLCLQSKFNPHIIANPERLEAVMIYVASGMGITLLPKYLEFYATPAIKLIPLEHKGEKAEVVAFHNETNLNPSLQYFLTELQGQIKTLQ